MTTIICSPSLSDLCSVYDTSCWTFIFSLCIPSFLCSSVFLLHPHSLLAPPPPNPPPPRPGLRKRIVKFLANENKARVANYIRIFCRALGNGAEIKTVVHCSFCHFLAKNYLVSTNFICISFAHNCSKTKRKPQQLSVSLGITSNRWFCSQWSADLIHWWRECEAGLAMKCCCV